VTHFASPGVPLDASARGSGEKHCLSMGRLITGTAAVNVTPTITTDCDHLPHHHRRIDLSVYCSTSFMTVVRTSDLNSQSHTTTAAVGRGGGGVSMSRCHIRCSSSTLLSSSTR